MRRTLEQQRAAYALRFVTARAGVGGAGELATHIRKTPIRILQNGLGQAVAFLLSNAEGKQEKPSYRLYGCLDGWLRSTGSQAREDRPCVVYRDEQGDGHRDLIIHLIEGSRRQYQLAEEEALSLFTWLKKFADAYLVDGGNTDAGA